MKNVDDVSVILAVFGAWFIVVTGISPRGILFCSGAMALLQAAPISAMT